MADASRRFRFPMEYEYKEEVIKMKSRLPIYFSQWCGPHKVIFGNHHNLHIRHLVHSITRPDPLEHCGKPNKINCMMSNPSQTKLAVGHEASVRIYGMPLLNHLYQINDEKQAAIHYVCWLDDNRFATINGLGEVVIRTWQYGQFILHPNRLVIPDFQVPGDRMTKYHTFDYHSGTNELLFLSNTLPILFLMNSELTETRVQVFDLPSSRSILSGPKMIAIHPTNPYYFVGTSRAIVALDPRTFRIVFIFRCNDFCYSLSVAGDIITYTVGREPRDVRFLDMDVRSDVKIPRNSLMSQNKSTNTILSSDTEKDEIDMDDLTVSHSRPIILTHCYSSDRTKLFCGGLLTEQTVDVMSYRSHAAIWRVLRYAGLKRKH